MGLLATPQSVIERLFIFGLNFAIQSFTESEANLQGEHSTHDQLPPANQDA
jgi:hypothetical protein